MATSSITKNFVISGTEQVEMFITAIEESAQNRPIHVPVTAKEIKGETELREMISSFRSIFVSIWHYISYHLL